MPGVRARRPRAVLFDLDCTLTDRAATVAAFAERFADRFGNEMRPTGDGLSPVEATVAATITAADADGYAPRRRVFARLRRDLQWKRKGDVESLKRFWHDVFPACARPAAGLRETLLGLRERGVKIGVVSNGGADTQLRKIDALGIRSLLSSIVVSGAVGVRKPHRRIFDLALDGVGARPDECWMVGDHPALDMAGARAAGLRRVWLRGVHPWPTPAPPPDEQIDRLPDVLTLI